MDYITERALRIHKLTGDDGVPSAGDLPLFRMYAVLSFAKGAATTAEDVHDSWVAWQAGIFPEHRSCIPYDQLSEQVQRYDDKYVEAIHRAATA